MRTIKCDNCGASEEVMWDKQPAPDGGAEIRFARQSNPEIGLRIEVCFECARRVVAALPGLRDMVKDSDCADLLLG